MRLNKPVRLFLIHEPQNSFGDILRSLRLKNNLTQRRVAAIVGVYVSKRGTTLISDYENNRVLPDFSILYKLSVLFHVSPDYLFDHVIKEHYKRFFEKHVDAFIFYSNGRKRGVDESILSKNVNKKTRYYFCTNGVLKHDFSRFVSVIKKNMEMSKLTPWSFIKEIEKSGSKCRYSYGYVHHVVNGKRVPGTRIVFDFASFFKIDPLCLYKTVINEKAIAHINNAKEQWKLVKESFNKFLVGMDSNAEAI